MGSSPLIAAIAQVLAEPSFQLIFSVFSTMCPLPLPGRSPAKYQKELLRKIQTQGKDEVLGSPLQRQIHDMNSEVLLLAAGYNRDTVVKALNDASPQAAHKTDYGQGIVKTVWEQPQVKQFIADRMIWKAQQGIPLEEKRLDRLHLATDIELQPEPLRAIAIERE